MWALFLAICGVLFSFFLVADANTRTSLVAQTVKCPPAMQET